MKREDMISIMITFIMGIFAGSFLYLTQFASIETKFNTPDQKSTLKLSVVAEAYGSCDPNCPSFQMTHDGSYRYFRVLEKGQDPVLKEGIMPFIVINEIVKELTPQELKKQSLAKPLSSCDKTDNIQLRYIATLNNETYYLDSCSDQIVFTGKLWQALNNAWTYLGEQ